MNNRHDTSINNTPPDDNCEIREELKQPDDYVDRRAYDRVVDRVRVLEELLS